MFSYKPALLCSILFACLPGAAGAAGPDITTHVLGAQKQMLSATTDTVRAGYYEASTLSAVDPDLAAGNIAVSTNIFGITGAFTDPGGTAIAGDVLTGKTFYAGGAKTGTMPTQTLSAENDIVTAGYYAGTTLSAVDPDLIESNINTGVTIFGKAGSKTGASRNLPDTGQTISHTSYDDATHNPAASQPSYNDNNDGTVTDDRTSLMWPTCATATAGCKNTPIAWEAAKAYCEGLTFPTGGWSDWRMPNIKELFSIVNFAATSPSINTTYFKNTMIASQGIALYWTSTTNAADTTYAWANALGQDGHTFSVLKTEASVSLSRYNYVRCVRGGPPFVGGEWVSVPGNSSFGTSDFYAMKYEAKNVGGVATSQADVTPWVNISQTAAIAACSALGSGYHLLTIPETQTINRSIEAQTANWANGVIGSLVSAGGGLKRGNVGITDSASYAGGSALYGASRNLKSKLVLSNGGEIWDWSGNVWEWIYGAGASGTLGTPGGYTFDTGGWYEWNSVSPNLSQERPILGPSNSGWTADYGIGRYYGMWTTDGVLRGGGYGSGAPAGVFSLYVYYGPAYTDSSFGFRCGR